MSPLAHSPVMGGKSKRREHKKGGKSKKAARKSLRKTRKHRKGKK